MTSSITTVSDATRLAQTAVQGRVQATMTRLSSGLRLHANEDAGVTQSTRVSAQIRGLSIASQGMEEAASMAQTANGGLGDIATLLARQRELAVQASTTNDPAYLQEYDAQMKKLGETIDRIATSTVFGGTSLLDGSVKDRQIQVDAKDLIKGTITIASTATGDPAGFDRAGLGLDKASIATATAAEKTITTLDTALQTVNEQRLSLSNLQERLGSTGFTSLKEMSSTLSEAQSRVVDVDFASSTADMTRNQILVQAGIGMLTPSSPRPQSVLDLLQG